MIDERATGEALLRLHHAVRDAVRQNLMAEGEDLAAVRERLSNTYAYIGAPVGINAQHLVEIMDALLAFPPDYVAPDAVAMGRVANRPPPRYGPAVRDLPSLHERGAG